MTAIEEAQESAVRIQNFDTKGLSRRDEVGTKFAFDGAIEPANKVINLFKKLPIGVFSEFPDRQLAVIKDQANQIYNLFEQILKFDETQAEATSEREKLLGRVNSVYQDVFSTLHPFISYAVAQTVDFSRLEAEGRAAVQGIADKTKDALTKLDETQEQAESILVEVRQAAAEQGVSQQAVYFAQEATNHETQAERWRTSTGRWAAALILYGVASFFFHKIPWLSPTNLAESIQFLAGKVLIFFVLSFMLVLSARNFMSNRHNGVVNKQRQNALQTFKALVDAGGTPETRDTVLNHAAASIFRPQDTGYTRPSPSGGPSSNSIVEMLPTPGIRVDSG